MVTCFTLQTRIMRRRPSSQEKFLNSLVMGLCPVT
jgi:hypothetical protein